MLALLRNPGLGRVEIHLLGLSEHDPSELSINMDNKTWAFKGLVHNIGEPLERSIRREIIVGVYDLSSQRQITSMVYEASNLINEPRYCCARD